MTQIEALASIAALEGDAYPADYAPEMLTAILSAGLACIEPRSGRIGLTDAGAEVVWAA